MNSKNNTSGKLKRQRKLVQKRTTLLQKLAYILKPFVIYMLIKTIAMFLLAVLIPSLPITGIVQWVEQYSNQLSAIINGAASVIAVRFVLNDFLIEVNTSGETDIDQRVPGQFFRFLKNGFFGYKDKSNAKKTGGMLLCIILGITSSLALNILLELAARISLGQSTLGSEKYEIVETIQYSVPIWLGILLYGLISPMVEEIVFRGIIYNRIQRFYEVPKAVIFSSLLFGVFHANLPQFLYGTAMGMLMAVCYHYLDCFAAPMLIHMSANLFVFMISGLTAWTDFFVTPVWCLFFMFLSLAALVGIKKIAVME